MSVFSHPAVCNTGPMIGLARAGLEWLPFRLFPKVYIPAEVLSELTCRESPDAARIQSVLSPDVVLAGLAEADPLLLAELDMGEAAVIAATLQMGKAVAILDERKARKLAIHVYGLRVKGTAGLLVQAKRIGLIPDVKTPMEAMLAGGYHLSNSLIASTLHEAGED